MTKKMTIVIEVPENQDPFVLSGMAVKVYKDDQYKYGGKMISASFTDVIEEMSVVESLLLEKEIEVDYYKMKISENAHPIITPPGNGRKLKFNTDTWAWERE